MTAELPPPSTEDSVQTFRTPKSELVRAVNDAACLVYIYPTGPQMGTRYALNGEPVFIGRQEDCVVRNTDGSVSRYHAKLVRGNDGEYTVSDLNSTNGTFVNNQRKQEGVLRDGDYLRIGNCIYRFLAGGNIEAEYHEEIYRLTVLDGLTQVHNRRYLTEFLDREIARSHRHNRSLALVMFDIDHFKAINDNYGHLTGDMTLRELSTRVKAVVRQDELLARYGGEEFAVVLPEAELAEARLIAERIRAVTESHPFVFNGVSYTVTVSLGGAITRPAAQLNTTEIIAEADANLYKAKLAGRNRAIVG
ncbi:MAG: GGDEF domain-containing protein [Planctomycetia bacterium]|nr:GGDEF domain-containing protein [Planctomycetia bacterium]